MGSLIYRRHDAALDNLVVSVAPQADVHVSQGRLQNLVRLV